jgi:hypothetical protein
VELTEGMLFVELANAGGDCLWHNDRVDSKTELALGCLGEFVVKKVKDKTETISDEAVPIVFSLLCGAWYHCHCTYSTKA